MQGTPPAVAGHGVRGAPPLNSTRRARKAPAATQRSDEALLCAQAEAAAAALQREITAQHGGRAAAVSGVHSSEAHSAGGPYAGAAAYGQAYGDYQPQPQYHSVGPSVDAYEQQHYAQVSIAAAS